MILTMVRLVGKAHEAASDTKETRRSLRPDAVHLTSSDSLAVIETDSSLATRLTAEGPEFTCPKLSGEPHTSRKVIPSAHITRLLRNEFGCILVPLTATAA